MVWFPRRALSVGGHSGLAASLEQILLPHREIIGRNQPHPYIGDTDVYSFSKDDPGCPLEHRFRVYYVHSRWKRYFYQLHERLEETVPWPLSRDGSAVLSRLLFTQTLS
eukprot:842530-Amphidinium_carterae.1